MWWLKSLILSLQVSASHIGTDSNPGCYISDLISTYGLESYREHGSRPYIHTGDLEEAPGSGSDQLSSGCCDHLGSEPENG